MRRGTAPRRPDEEGRSDQLVVFGRGTGWAAVLGVFVVVLAAAGTIVDKRESLQWLWVALIVAGVSVGASAALVASPWWQQRQMVRRSQAEIATVHAQERARDVRGHFEPRGRGVLPFSGHRGWYFVGRTRALRELTAWLADPAADPSVRVVTGGPGAGKSAVLGQLVLLSDPTTRRNALAYAVPGTLPPEGCIDAAVHARGKSLWQLVTEFATAADVEASTPEDFLNAILQRGRGPLVFVVDALDEASQPEEIIRELLRPLSMHGNQVGIRLLIGTRPYLVSRFGNNVTVLDLDDPAYFDSADVAEYVRRILLAVDEPDVSTPYRGHPETADQVANAVAVRATNSFLVASLVSRALAGSTSMVDPESILGPTERIPTEVRALLVPVESSAGVELTEELQTAHTDQLPSDNQYSATGHAELTRTIREDGIKVRPKSGRRSGVSLGNGEVIGALLTSAAAFVAAALGLGKAVTMPTWLVVVLAGFGGLVATAAAFLKVRNDRRARRQGWEGLLSIPPSKPGVLPTVASVSPYDIGVSLSKYASTSNDRPPYISRDIDNALRRALADDLLVVMKGDAKAGKSRSTFEAAVHVLGDYDLLVPKGEAGVLAKLFAPDTGVALRRPTLLWLDEIDRFLTPSGGLDLALLEYLARHDSS